MEAVCFDSLSKVLKEKNQSDHQNPIKREILECDYTNQKKIHKEKTFSVSDPSLSHLHKHCTVGVYLVHRLNTEEKPKSDREREPCFSAAQTKIKRAKNQRTKEKIEKNK
ncbi:hypothetical protein Sjap_017629 [Stephania japonica]|uniref:Uncharacterized protein n=1 Tax=Stephania japonica TaxID=461633 RepID=A0AAP0NK56_9MAGN